MRIDTNTATLARGAFVFDRVEHQGWEPEAAACVSIAMHPFDQSGAGGKADRAIRQAAREFAREVRDLHEREALVAALGALVTYITLARRARDRTHESWWMQIAETIERKLESSVLGTTDVNVDIYSATEREAMAASGIHPADTARVAAYVIEHPSCRAAHVADALRLDAAVVRLHMSYGVSRGLIGPDEISDDALSDLGIESPASQS
jgi:hypothetical protein